MAFVNLGAGFAEAGKNIAATAGAWTLEAQKAETEKEKAVLVDQLMGARQEKQNVFTSGESEKERGFKTGESALDRTSREKISEATRQATIAAASISAGAHVQAARISADVHREALTPAEVRTAQWFSKATPEEQKAFQDVLIAKLPPTKPPEGYRKTEGGNLENIPGGPADPTVIAQVTGAKGREAPAGYRLGADNKTLEFIPGGPADPSIIKRASPMNNEQARDAGFADRMQISAGILKDLDKQGTSAWGRIAESIGKGGNYLQSADYQQFRQAKEDFINAQLRRESGAAINKDEFEKADRQYFPQPGDGADVIAQKARNRQTTYDAMVRGAGPAYKPAEIAPPAAPSVQTAPPEKRAIGRTYQTPNGLGIWMGNGWLRPAEPK